MTSSAPDAIVVGAGPNGLSAAIEIARAGHSVTVYEAADTVGGGTRTAELTLPGFHHDICSAMHPLLIASPFFQSMPLQDLGIEFAHPGVPFAQPFDDGSAAVNHRSVEETARRLGADGKRYARIFGPLVEHVDELVPPLLGPFQLPRHPFLMARFGLRAIRSAKGLVDGFETPHARALIAGAAAHSMLDLTAPMTGGVSMMLTLLAHAVGWPTIRGGSSRITTGMAAYLKDLGGEIVTGQAVTDLDELPRARAYMLDLTPRQVIEVAGRRLPRRYVKALGRFRYGPGVFKVDWALSEPVPWKAQECREAGTIHIGGPFEEIAASERDVNEGRVPERPYVLLCQQTVADPSRAPSGNHTLWGYCHVPSGCDVDMTERIEDQIERFAPGFRDTILARHAEGPARVEARNANYVGGDINGGIQDLWQHFTRPTIRQPPYSTPSRDIYICSSSTPPGGGVHGMCGYHAARVALRRAF